MEPFHLLAASVTLRFLLLFSVRVAGMLSLLPPFYKGLRELQGPNPVNSMGEGQGTPWMSRQFITENYISIKSITTATPSTHTARCNLSFQKPIAQITRTDFFHVKNIAFLHPSLSFSATETRRLHQVQKTIIAAVSCTAHHTLK